MQQVGTEAHKLPQTVKITKLPIDDGHVYDLTSTNPWIEELLSELMVSGMETDPDGIPQWDSHVHVNLSFTRKHNHTYRDHLIVKGNIVGAYQTHCVRCLKPMLSEFNHIFEACFIPDMFEKTPEYQDATHIYAGDSELELYFHSKGIIDFKELIHEHLFLTVDEFPLHDEECKGLCFTCGINLNEGSCEHTDN
ncbi:MAG: DUF177 domain-containing protein [Bacteriovoracaceae bacterium]|nr:DUF177 domain-containing protein [Bacteriovoracaceae bacterium]